MFTNTFSSKVWSRQEVFFFLTFCFFLDSFFVIYSYYIHFTCPMTTTHGFHSALFKLAPIWGYFFFRTVIFNRVIPSQGPMAISRDTTLSQLGKEKRGGPSRLRSGLLHRRAPHPQERLTQAKMSTIPQRLGTSCLRVLNLIYTTRQNLVGYDKAIENVTLCLSFLGLLSCFLIFCLGIFPSLNNAPVFSS